MVLQRLGEHLAQLSDWQRLGPHERESVLKWTIGYYGSKEPDSGEVALLATSLAQSGEQWSWPEAAATSDVPSTGGPGSLATLICPPIIAACGVWVPKLGVRGATAGAIDVLELVPGFSASLERESALQSLRKSGLVHCLSTEVFCPADREMFEYRSRTATKAVPALVAASLISKKLAIGCSAAAVDVRCGPSGNVGSTTSQCVAFSKLLCEAALECGIHASCIVVPANPPASPFFGRWESLNALTELLSGEEPDSWAARHIEQCILLADAALSNARPNPVNQLGSSASAALRDGRAREAFIKNLSAQGGSEAAVNGYLHSTFVWTEAVALSQGHVRIDPAGIQRALLRVNGRVPGCGDLIGVTLLAEPAKHVAAGTPLARVRYRQELAPSLVDAFAAEVATAVTTSEEPQKLFEQVAMIVDH